MRALLYKFNTSNTKVLVLFYFLVFVFFDSFQILLTNIQADRYIYLSKHYFYQVFIQTAQLGHVGITLFSLTFPVLFYLYIFRHICDDYELKSISSNITYSNRKKYISGYLKSIFIISLLCMLLFQLVNLATVYLFFQNGLSVNEMYDTYIQNLIKVLLDITLFSVYIALLSVVFGLLYFLQYNRYITLAITLAYVYMIQLIFKVGNVIQPFNEYDVGYRITYLTPLFLSQLIIIGVLYFYISKKETL